MDGPNGAAMFRPAADAVRAREWATVAIVWAACVVVLFARHPDLIRTPQFYAEDGVVFFRDAVFDGLGSLLTQYSGYHHLIPRAIAFAVAGAPVAAQPALYVWITVFVQAACCAALVPLMRTVVADAVLRAFTAVAAAAVVPANEMIGSLANLQWFLNVPLLGAAVVPLSRGARWFARAAAVLAGATTPLGLLAAPLAAVLWWRRPAGRDPWTPTMYAVASAVNVYTAPRDPNVRPSAHLLEAIASLTAMRVGDALVFGEDAMKALAATPLLGVLLGLAVLLIVLIALGAQRGPVLALVMGYFVVAPVALAALGHDLQLARFSDFTFFGADRYFWGPCTALVVALAFVLAGAAPARVARAVAAAALVAGFVTNGFEPVRYADSGWTASSGSIEAWRAARDRGSPAGPAGAAIPPGPMTVPFPGCAPGGHGGVRPVCPQ